MKFTYRSITQYINTDAKIEDISNTLNKIGLEVEKITDFSKLFDNFVIGYVEDVKAHPNSTKLNLCSVAYDRGCSPLQIVCGAQNVKAGQKIVLAKVGSIVPTSGLKIEEVNIRGVSSHGMICSSDELGIKTLCIAHSFEDDKSDGILVLPEDAPLGQSFSRYLNIDDIMLEIGLTPNRRHDSASAYHIALVLAAAGLGEMRDIGELPFIKRASVLGSDDVIDRDISGKSNFAIGDANDESDNESKSHDGRMFFSFFDIKGLKKKKRSGTSGVSETSDVSEISDESRTSDRNDISDTNSLISEMLGILHMVDSIHVNMLVNISNYTMFNFGYPTHMYDFDKINGDMVVRRAGGDEIFTGLDGEQYVLDTNDIVVGDEVSVLAVAGITGGDAAKIDENSNNIVLEIAYLDGLSILKTRRRLNINTDAQYRFENGIDVSMYSNVIKCILNLISFTHYYEQSLQFEAILIGGDQKQVKINEGQIRAEKIEKIEKNTLTIDDLSKITGNLVKFVEKTHVIDTNFDKIEEIVGIKIPHEKIELILSKMGFILHKHEYGHKIIIPHYKHWYLKTEDDLFEEVIRLSGLDSVIGVVPSIDAHAAISSVQFSGSKEVYISKKAGYGAVSRGFIEVITWSFYDKEICEIFGLDADFEIINPINNKMVLMRSSMIPNLLKIAVYNNGKNNGNIAIYECGNVYIASQNAPQKEALRISGLRTNSKIGDIHNRESDFYDLKADVQNILHQVFEIGLVEKCVNYVEINQDHVSISSSHYQNTTGDISNSLHYSDATKSCHYSNAMKNNSYQAHEKDVQNNYYHPHQAANIVFKNPNNGKSEIIGTLGALHPNILKRVKTNGTIFVFEIFLDKILDINSTISKQIFERKAEIVEGDRLRDRGIFDEISYSEHQVIDRELCFIIDEKIRAKTLVDCIYNVGKQKLKEIERDVRIEKCLATERNIAIEKIDVIDVYQNKEHLGDGKKSVAVRIGMRGYNHSISDTVIKAISDHIIDGVKAEIGGDLRSF